MNTSHNLTHAKEVPRPQFRRQMSIFIEAAPETVFRYLADISRHADWSAQTLSITSEPDPEHESSSTFASTALIGFLLPVAGHIRVNDADVPCASSTNARTFGKGLANIKAHLEARRAQSLANWEGERTIVGSPRERGTHLAGSDEEWE